MSHYFYQQFINFYLAIEVHVQNRYTPFELNEHNRFNAIDLTFMGSYLKMYLNLFRLNLVGPCLKKLKYILNCSDSNLVGPRLKSLKCILN